MNDDQIKTKYNLLDNIFIDLIESYSIRLINSDLIREALDLSGGLEIAVNKQRAELLKNKELARFYKKIIIKLKFVALPLLSDEEIVKLINKYFTWHIRIPEYDINEKLRVKLLTFNLVDNRDELKAKVKKAILGNKEVITGKANIRTIEAWLRNYNAKLGIGAVSNLAKTQYITDLTKNSSLNKDYINRLKILFNFYESLKISSKSPQGYEENMPVIVNGKLYIFRQGELEEIKGNKKIETKKVASTEKESEKETVEKIDENNPFEELQKMAEQYPEGSLERRAVEEELNKLKVKS